MARKLSVLFDELAQHHFETPEGFFKALKLFQEYTAATDAYPTFEEFQANYLDRLDDLTDSESKLLQKAFDYLTMKSLIVSGSQPRSPHKGNEQLLDEAVARFIEIQRTHHDVGSTNQTSKPLTKAFDEFISANKHNWKTDSASEQAFRDEVFPLFLELIGDIETDALRKDHVIAYKTAILNLPKNRRKMPAYRDLPISDLLTLSIPPKNQLANRTKSYYLGRLKTFLEWLGTNDYASAGLSAPLKNVIKTKTLAHQDKNQYSAVDLKKLFNSQDYKQGLHRYPSEYWVPLIGLFTGARENEICQLFTSDVYKDADTNLLVFDFNENNASETKKSLKRPFHARRFPIHRTLISLGLMDFVDEQKRRGELRLFPELPYRTRNKYADKFQRWFNITYTKRCGINTPKTSFHSLRHAFANHIQKQLNFAPNDFAFFIGQSPSGNETAKRYIKPDEINDFERRYRALKFSSIDFKAIRPWKSVRPRKNTSARPKRT